MHVMMDTETFGLQSDAAIIAVAAVRFDPSDMEKPLDETFFCAFDMNDTLKYGVGELATVTWWGEQDEPIRKAVCEGTVPVREGFAALDRFLRVGNPKYVWANSPAFDLVKLQRYYTKLGHDWVWPFTHRQEMDVRTLRQIAREFNYPIEYAEQMSAPYGLHHPLGDCVRQIRTVQACWQSLNAEGRWREYVR